MIVGWRWHGAIVSHAVLTAHPISTAYARLWILI
jgi:hypothetical protein